MSNAPSQSVSQSVCLWVSLYFFFKSWKTVYSISMTVSLLYSSILLLLLPLAPCRLLGFDSSFFSSLEPLFKFLCQHQQMIHYMTLSPAIYPTNSSSHTFFFLPVGQLLTLRQLSLLHELSPQSYLVPNDMAWAGKKDGSVREAMQIFCDPVYFSVVNLPEQCQQQVQLLQAQVYLDQRYHIEEPIHVLDDAREGKDVRWDGKGWSLFLVLRSPRFRWSHLKGGIMCEAYLLEKTLVTIMV